jgi:hypothetical protein
LGNSFWHVGSGRAMVVSFSKTHPGRRA